MGRRIGLMLVPLLVSCATQLRRPTATQRQLDHADAQLARANAARVDPKRARSQLVRLGDRAAARGKLAQALADYQAAHSDKRHALARRVLAREVKRAERLRAGGDSMSAFAVLARAQAFTRVRSPAWTRQADALARALWPRVNAFMGMHYFVPALTMARWLTSPFPASHWTHRSQTEVVQAGRAFYEQKRSEAQDVWTRFFFGRMAAQFGGTAPGAPVHRPTHVRLPTLHASCTTTNADYKLPGAGGLRETEITVRVRSTCKRSWARVPHTKYYTVKKRVPVYRTEWKFGSETTSGYTPNMGQEHVCVSRASNGRCVTYAVTKARPRKTTSSIAHVTSRQVFDHYNNKLIRKARTTYTNERISNARATVNLLAASATPVSYELYDGADVAVKHRRLRHAYESMKRQQVATLVSHATDEASMARAALAGGIVRSPALVTTYGVDGHQLRAIVAGRLQLAPPSTKVTATYPSAERPEVVTALARRRVRSRKARDEALADARAEDEAFHAGQRVYSSHINGTFDDLYSYLPTKTFSVGAALSSSPLRGTDLVQTLDVHFFRVRNNVLSDLSFIGGLPVAGTGATTAGAGYELRVFLNEDSELNGSFYTLGAKAIVEVGQKLEDPALSRPYEAFLGSTASFDLSIPGHALLGVEIDPNVLQLAGSGGPAGMNRSTILGARLRIPLPGRMFLRLAGAWYLGAEHAWNWSLGLCYDRALLPEPDIRRKQDKRRVWGR